MTDTTVKTINEILRILCQTEKQTELEVWIRPKIRKVETLEKEIAVPVTKLTVTHLVPGDEWERFNKIWAYEVDDDGIITILRYDGQLSRSVNTTDPAFAVLHGSKYV